MKLEFQECDVSQISKINALFMIPAASRDANWYESFQLTAPNASFKLDSPNLVVGPDNRQYLSLRSPEPNIGFEAYSIHNLAETALLNGVGVVLNFIDGQADFVFRYGDLLDYAWNKRFFVFDSKKPVLTEEVEALGQEFMVGSPSESYFPTAARKVIKKHLESKENLNNIGVLLRIKGGKTPTRELIFSIYPEDYSDKNQLKIILDRIAWFLPSDYILSSASKTPAFTHHFSPL